MPITSPLSASPTTLTDRRRRRAATNHAFTDQAKGILILLYRIDAEHAFDVLREWAKETGSTPATVARALVFTVCGDERRQTWDHTVRRYVESALRDAGFDAAPAVRGRRTNTPARRLRRVE